MAQLGKQATKFKPIIIDCETTSANPHEAKLLGVSMSQDLHTEWQDKATGFTFYHNLKAGNLIGQNIKYDMVVLKRHGFKIPKAYFDTQVAYYLLFIDHSRKLENMVKHVFGHSKDDLLTVYNKSTGEDRKHLPEDWYTKVNNNYLTTYAQEDAYWTERLYHCLSDTLSADVVLEYWFYTVEMPIVNILTEMELKGVKINRLKLEQLRDESRIKAKELEKKLRWLAGNVNLNLNSPLQLRELLYKQYRLPKLDKTETGEPSTDKATLKRLAAYHAFPKLLLEYREIEKVLSTYTDNILDRLDSNNRLHTIFNQTLTNTRRFSSDSPNLQNIPTRSAIGKQVKECFVPEAGCTFLIADYSQLEPRILAHLSNDKTLVDVYKNNEDIYLRAVEICKQKGKLITRDQAKILMLSLMYGKTPYGLAKDFNCTQEEAKEIIDAVLHALKGVDEYIQWCAEEVIKTKGWMKTIAGLPLFVGNPFTSNKAEYYQVLRCAVNYPIQGSSQDILKTSMVRIYNEFKHCPVLTVHDELVYELETSACNPEGVVHLMETAWNLKVPLKVEWKMSDKWEK